MAPKAGRTDRNGMPPRRAVRPVRTVEGVLSQDAGRTMIEIGGLALEVFVDETVPSAAARTKSRDRAREAFRDNLGSMVRLEARQVGGALVDARLSGADPAPAARAAAAAGAARSLGLGAQPVEDFVAAKAEASHNYLTSDRVVALNGNTAGISPVPEINVIAVGIGEKISDGSPTGNPSIKLFVRHKYPKGHIAPEHLLPTAIRGLMVDVEEIGEVRPLAATVNPRLQITPAQPGSSVGFAAADGTTLMAGTFGALVKAPDGGLFVLSNNHVLADEGRLQPGAPIYQAGLLDLAPQAAPRQIAALARFLPLTAQPLRVDAALALAATAEIVSPVVLGIGQAPSGAVQAAVDMIVHKFGRTTGYTAGRVVSTATDITVDYDTGSFTFVDQIMISGLDGSAFSDVGDSGSLILERSSNKATGLMFAGSSSFSVANHIDDVLTAFGVALA